MSTNSDQQPPVLNLDLRGEKVGDYVLIDFIDEGGFAKVYLGQHQQKTDIKVAIKILSTSLADQSSQELFIQEGRILQELNHQYIVEFFQFGIYEYEKGGVKESIPYIVMSKEKSSLRQLYPQGKIVPLDKVVRYVKQVASALEYAHNASKRVIHRDVKPENILLANKKGAYSEDTVRLSDFGIAVLPKTPPLDKDILSWGAPAYQAPEQRTDKYPHPESDQYALAVMVYEWLCGKLPFEGSPEELATHHLLTPPPSLCQRNPDISPAVERVVMKGLSKHPEDRYINVLQFAQALEDAAFPAPLPLPEPTTKHTRRNILIGLGIGIAVVSAPFVDQFLVNAWSKITVQSQTIAVFPGHHASVEAVAWSADGSYVASGSRDGQVLVWDIQTQKIRASHKHVGRVFSIAWFHAHDGRYIASVGEDGIHIWDATNGKIYGTYLQHGIHVAVWSTIGDLAVGIEKTALVFDTPTSKGNGFKLPDNRFTAHTDIVNALSFSPTNDKVASASNDGTVWVWNSENAHEIFPYRGHQVKVLALDWSPQFDMIASGGNDYSVQIWRAPQTAIVGADDLFDTYLHTMPVLAVAWSPNGLYLVSGGKDKIAQVWETISKSRSSYTGHTAPVNAVAFSPDSKLVASGSDDKTVHIWRV